MTDTELLRDIESIMAAYHDARKKSTRGIDSRPARGFAHDIVALFPRATTSPLPLCDCAVEGPVRVGVTVADETSTLPTQDELERFIMGWRGALAMDVPEAWEALDKKLRPIFAALERRETPGVEVWDECSCGVGETVMPLSRHHTSCRKRNPIPRPTPAGRGAPKDGGGDA